MPSFTATVTVDLAPLEAAIRALISETNTCAEILATFDVKPYLRFNVQEDRASLDWYDIWTKDLM